MSTYRQLEPQPEISPATAAAVLDEVFGLRGSLWPLHADRDRNFGVAADDGQRYVLKFQNPADSEAVLDLQTQALAHIADVDPSLPTLRSRPTRRGEAWHCGDDETGRPTFARLFVHLDGHHAGVGELGQDALFAWGGTVARLGRALRGFFHPAAGYRTVWDLRRFPELRVHLEAVAPAQQPLVAEVLERFERTVAPAAAGLRAQVVHGDMSPENVLIDEAGTITGILDFGDMTHTMLVNDLAITVADVVCGRPDALAAAKAMIAGYDAVTPLEADEAALLGDLIAARCATVALLAIDDGHSPAELHWALLTELHQRGFDRVADELARVVPAFHEHSRRWPVAPMGVLLEARRKTLGPLELSYDAPLHLTQGFGVHVTDAAGQRYLDAYNNVPVVGHSHPRVVAAVSAQLRRLNTNTRYLHEVAVELAERLLATAPPHLDRVLLVNSGSEANDVALRIARWATGHPGVIATAFAYHGITTATTAISPETWSTGTTPDPAVQLVQPPGGADGATRPAAATIEQAAERLSASGVGVAAMCVDSAFTSDGIRGPAGQWIRHAVDTVHAHGGLFIADEVQAGYGRTGEAMWSVTASGAVPDLITLGKPMGNGYPVAAVLTSAALADEFMGATDFFSTFGGNTAACAAALAVLDTLEDEGLFANAAAMGQHLLDRVTAVAADREMIVRPRGWGLLVGADIVDPATGEPDPALARRVVNRLVQLGVLIGTTGPAGNVLKIRPPLVIERSHVDEIADRLAQALDELRR